MATRKPKTIPHDHVPNNKDLVFLREYIDQRVDYERDMVEQRFSQHAQALELQAKEYERRISELSELLETKVEAERLLVEERRQQQQAALALQAKEYERRLLELNNAHMRAETERGKVVSRELFDRSADEFAAFKIETVKQLTTIQTRSMTWSAAWGIGITIITLIIHFVRF